MGESLTLPVPETLHATYAVAFVTPPADPRELARERVTRLTEPPLRDLVLRMLDSPLLTLDLRPAAGFPPLPADLLAAFGATRRELVGIAAASHLLAVRASYRPGWPPAHEWATRAIAGAVGGDPPVPVIDVFTPQVLGEDRLRRSLPGPDGAVRLTDWILLPHTSGPDGFWFTTKGLARFGLPELQTENVPEHLVGPWGRLLNGLASRLLGLWLERLAVGERPVVVELPEVVPVGLRDVAAAQGDREPSHREVDVRLRLDTGEDGEPVLTVPAAEDGPDGLESLCAALFGASRPA
ncbi:hypothetical protein GCM10023085_11260 [Actinomadura viridis]|uniref:Uncharacterized protein n=1 Tax=Actinomadura viridis TaxID=58110 RepID=A0A931GS24_9ACTN|nr:hypothetical protein [Actinomadura viridis]MBG6093501.1 hypothetical protein [Actinomadura viridis]